MSGKKWSSTKKLFSYISTGVNPDTRRRHCLPHTSLLGGFHGGIYITEGIFEYVSTADLEEWFIDPKGPPRLC
ncbi:protein E18B [Elephant endotheliotropic herpesvirus 6]|nr:protein E18B [Elephant endotheliotropic herpesvirus 6]